MANRSKYHLPPAELSSHREEEVEEADEEVRRALIKTIVLVFNDLVE